MKQIALLFVLTGAALAQTVPLAVPSVSAPGSLRSGGVTQRPDCNAGGESDTCVFHSGVFAAPTRPNGSGHRSLVENDLQTYGPSVDVGSNGSGTVTFVNEAPHVIFGTSGVDQYQSAYIRKNGVGDLGGLYYYVYGGGFVAQSDEGVEGLVIESGEINGYFHGTIAGGGARGATALQLAPDNSASHQWGYTCAGCMLLDISKGAIAGSLNGKSIPFGSTYLNQLPTTGVTINDSPGALPRTRAWCSTLAPIPVTDTAGLGTSRTVSCQLGSIGGATPAFTAGGVVTIAGQWYPEQATLTAVGRPSGGVQTLTLLARNVNPAGSVIFQGGIAGQSLSFDANFASTGFRSSYYVFGSVDGVNLIYGSQEGGNLAGRILPRQGGEAEQITSGFHLYPSAEIVYNTAAPSAPALEPNNVDWSVGDTVEDPRFQSFAGYGIRDVCQAFSPPDGTIPTGCLVASMQGPGVSGSYRPFRIENYNKPELYVQAGGSLDPVVAFDASGPFGDLIRFHSGPSGGSRNADAVIDIQGTFAADNKPFNLFSLPSGRQAGATKITYDPATKLVGFPQGLSFGSLATAANCSAASSPAACGSAASGSVVITSGGKSVTVITSAVTAGSQILITPDASLSSKLGVTCNANPATAFAPFGITARTPGRSFTLSIAGTVAGGPNCYSYTILN